MDITPQDTAQQPISDDQELAKALAGVLPDEPEPVVPPVVNTVPEVPELQFEETPAPGAAPAVSPAALVPEEPIVAAQAADAGLEGIKKDAIEELKPLVDKVNLPPEEKFSTYLLLIRSTDDASLIEPAHKVALSITDESARAQALLDIIKEIDYLSHSQNSAE